MMVLKFKKGKKPGAPPRDVVAFDKEGRLCLVGDETKYNPKPGDVCECEVVKNLRFCTIVVPKTVKKEMGIIIVKKYTCGHERKKLKIRNIFVPVSEADKGYIIKEREIGVLCPRCQREAEIRKRELEEKYKKLEYVLRARAREVDKRPRTHYAINITVQDPIKLERAIEALRKITFLRKRDSFRLIFLTKEQLEWVLRYVRGEVLQNKKG